jgi:hypothetical protein
MKVLVEREGEGSTNYLGFASGPTAQEVQEPVQSPLQGASDGDTGLESDVG